MQCTMPPAEHDTSSELVRLLLHDQFPHLAALPLRALATGWDNTLFRLGDDLVVRLPRRAAAAPLVEHEQRWLPDLAPRLPLPVPVPVYAGRPGRGYPWRWSVVAYREGETAAHAPGLDADHAARDLASFLARLHVPAPRDAPANRVRGRPLASLDAAFHGNLVLAGPVLDAAAAERVWSTATSAPVWARAPVWLHGDLHPANLLVAGTRLAAVLDFGDMTSGDPATDLAIAWLLLPRADQATFWDVYRTSARHGADDALTTRAHGWALHLATVFLARSADNPTMRGIGERSIDDILGLM